MSNDICVKKAVTLTSGSTIYMEVKPFYSAGIIHHILCKVPS